MVYPSHNKIVRLFFDFYTSWIINADFESFQVEGDLPSLADKPLLIIANHFSWWDGFFQYQLNNTRYKKRFHVMMLEEQLSKRMFLTKLGVFGVKKGTRDAMTSLAFAAKILEKKENMLLIFPQGKIESMHECDFRFESGVERLIAKSKNINVVFVATLVDYFSERKPTVINYLKLYSPIGEDVASDYNKFYTNSMANLKMRF